MLPIQQWAAPGARLPDTTAPGDIAPDGADSASSLDFAALLHGDRPREAAAAADGEALPRGGKGLPVAAAEAGARAGGTAELPLAMADPLVVLSAPPPPAAGLAGSGPNRAAVPLSSRASSGLPGAGVPAARSPDAAGAAMRAHALPEAPIAPATAPVATATPSAPPPLAPAVAQVAAPSPYPAGAPEARAAAMPGAIIPEAAAAPGSNGAAPPPATPILPPVPRGDVADAVSRALAKGGEPSGDVLEGRTLLQTAPPATTSQGASPATAPAPPPAGGGAATAGPAPAGAGIATPPGAPGWNEALGDRILWMAGSRIGNADIQLHPVEMGPLRIRVSVEDGATSVAFQAQHPATREAIEQALPRLREALSEQGLNLGQATVTDHGSRERRPGAEQGPAGAQLADAGEDQALEVPEPAAATSRVPARTAIDLFA